MNEHEALQEGVENGQGVGEGVGLGCVNRKDAMALRLREE